jgi:hypothetical protein
MALLEEVPKLGLLRTFSRSSNSQCDYRGAKIKSGGPAYDNYVMIVSWSGSSEETCLSKKIFTLP